MKKAAAHTKKEKLNITFLKYLDKIIQPGVANLTSIPIKTKNISVGEQVITYQATKRFGKTASLNSKDLEALLLRSKEEGKAENFYMHFSYSDIDTIESARSGIKFTDFKNIYDLMKLPNNKWAEIIGISERTMQSILKEKRNFDQNKSEKLLSFLTLIEYALDVLGNEENIHEWLNYKSPALQGKAPVDYVDTFQGITMLREQLFKIDSGNLV